MFFSLSFFCKIKSKLKLFKFLFNQYFYYQFTHVFYMQLYFMSVYFLSSEWSSQDYNSYWKSKSNQSSQSVSKPADQSQLPASKQSLMITVDTAAASELWPVYSNFEQEANFHCDQDWYEQIIEDWLQSFYFIWSYHVAEDFNFDDKNIYNVNSDQIQDNQNLRSDQKKSEQSESDFEDYFADYVDILDLKTKIC